MNRYYDTAAVVAGSFGAVCIIAYLFAWAVQ